MNTRVFGIIACLIAVLSWGTMFPIMSTVLPKVNPFFFTAIRYTLAGFLFMAVLAAREGIRSLFDIEKGWLLLSLGSMGFAGFGFLVFFGQQLAGPHGAFTASVFMALMPMLSVFVNRIFRKIRPLPLTVVFICLSFFGAIFAATRGDFRALLQLGDTLVANIVITLGAFCWVSYTIGAINFPQWSSLKYTTVTTMFSLPTIYAVNIVLHSTGMVVAPSTGVVFSMWPQIAYMVVIAAFVAVLSWNTGNKILTPINGVLFMDVVPAMAFAVSTFCGHAPSAAQVFGA